MMRLVIGFMILVQLLSVKAKAISTLYLSDLNNQYNLNKYILALRDARKQLLLGDISRLPDSAFFNLETQSANFGYDDANYWMKFKISDTSASTTKWKLVLNYALIDTACLFIFDGYKTKKFIKGDLTIRPGIDFPNTHHAFDLMLEKNRTYTCYMHFTGNDNKSFPLVIENEHKYDSNNMLNHNFNGIYTGIMMAMILYNMFLFLSVREKIYLYYTLFAFFMLIALLALNGYTYWLFYPNFINLANSSNLWSIGLAAIFGSLFVIRFLHISYKEKATYYLLSSIIGLSSILVIRSLIASFNPVIFLSTVKLASFVTFYFLFVMLGVIIYKQVKHVKESRFLLIAWSMYLIGVGITAMKYAGFINDNIWTHYSVQIGSMLEITLLSFALADRLKILENAKKDADEQVLQLYVEKSELMSQQNIMLEEKINQRTAVISHQNKELEKKSKELTKLVEELTQRSSLIDLLYRELNHRVKNNLQFVSSLLKLQANKIKNSQARFALENSRHRIETISIIHKILYKTDIKDTIILNDYVENVVDYLNNAVSYNLNYSIHNQTEKIAIDLDYAVYISLIILEIVTNSLKHAFDDKNADNQIFIKSNQNHNILNVEVYDNGKGIDIEEIQQGFGLDLVNILIQQLKGKYKIINNGGAGFLIEIPYSNAK